MIWSKFHSGAFEPACHVDLLLLNYNVVLLGNHMFALLFYKTSFEENTGSISVVRIQILWYWTSRASVGCSVEWLINN